MEKNELIEIIMSYKKSSAFITAYELGIFNLLHKRALDLQSLCGQGSFNEKHIYPFLLYLKSIHLIDELNGNWWLSSGFEPMYTQLLSLDSMIHHEKSIFQNWMSPNRLMQSLKANIGERDFDRVGFTETEKKLYYHTMYGTNNMKILSLYMIRELRGLKNPVVLEYGRSKDNILKGLKNAGYRFAGYCMQDISANEFDVIILYNTIHYYDEEEFHAALCLFHNLLRKDGRILILDLFYQDGNKFSSEILLDWVTHGGTNFLTREKTEEELNKNHFETVRSINIQDINITMMVVARKAE